MTSRKTAPRCFRCWRWDGASNSLQKQLPHSSKRSLNGAPISYSELALRGIAAAAAIVLEGDVHHHAAGGRLKVHDQRLDVLRAAEAGDGGVVDWRMDPEAEALIVEAGDGVADDHVGQLGDALANELRIGFELHAGQRTGDLHGGGVVHVEDDAALDVPGDLDHGRGGAARIRLLLHRDVGDIDGAGEGLREHGIGGVDERLDQLHLHDSYSPAGTATAASPSTYLTTSYSSSGFTGFCTKWRAPFCSAATMFSW